MIDDDIAGMFMNERFGRKSKLPSGYGVSGCDCDVENAVGGVLEAAAFASMGPAAQFSRSGYYKPRGDGSGTDTFPSVGGIEEDNGDVGSVWDVIDQLSSRGLEAFRLREARRALASGGLNTAPGAASLFTSSAGSAQSRLYQAQGSRFSEGGANGGGLPGGFLPLALLGLGAVLVMRR